MNKMELWWVGKTHFKYIKEGIEDYSLRLKHFCNLTIREFGEAKGEMDSQRIIKKEEIELINALQKNEAYLVLLDEHGLQYNSIQFANILADKINFSSKKIIFVIGGAYGLGETLKAKADLIISFGKFTYSHQLVRILILEQLYRSFTIIHNKPYHNE